MSWTVSLVFVLHSLLCSGYVAYLTFLLSNWMVLRPEVSPLDIEAVLGTDERVVTLTAHTTLMLYLFYAEIYLYHTYRLIGPALSR